MSALEFQGIEVTFGSGSDRVRAVGGVDLYVPDGEIVGLVGESGSGKSTLAKAAVGLVEPDNGRILLDDVDLVRARGEALRHRRRVQMVFQDPSSCLDPRMRIGRSIEEALVSRSRRDRERSTRDSRRGEVDSLLQDVGLRTAFADRLPHQLSGGQRQRVAIARALAAGPSVMLADEITSALDVSVQGAVLNLLRELQRELGLTVLFVSHNLAVVKHVCDRVAVMHQGIVVEQGPVDEVLERPDHHYVRDLLAAVPQIGVPLW
ncbi:ABC transporter ATP-binding protein [Solicola gregarius]|uniref:ATP-binding cassette domain-containing protein n=1 Tax=Solicola gregarius TaxID=2908642 RepID=A0AA46TJ53_9ACTN|nr:ATP-binding cassette domain-containing protein [Solicola gregarius]UYM06065.1 ATP-binding cassette domain-containing protein [Solicola gregarius]